jgi:alkylation response protein AidB-like acyl-CoA dehydrogenase
MDFSFSEEQSLLQDSVQRFIQNDYSFEARQKLVKADEGYSRTNWRSFAELGWLALPFGEEVGGFGGTSIETMILMEEFGKGLVVEPYLSTVLMAGQCIADGGSAVQRETVLAEIMSGTKLAALAFVEPQARFNLADVMTTAAKDGEYVLNGSKGVVFGGPGADYLVVPARTAGEQKDREGITLFLVDAAAEGISRRDYPTIDGHRASEIAFENVRVPADGVLGEVNAGLNLLERVIDNAILAVGAEAVGAMEVLYKATVEYCQTREQFGQPIGKFQVLQHRMVDMFMEHEQTKSLLYMAAMQLAEGYTLDARKAVSALKVRVGKGGRFVGQSAIQLHGGMGMTDDLAVGHYFKRLTAIDTMFGNAAFHLKRYASLDSARDD